MAFAKAKLDDEKGYVYETDAAGNLTAIVFTGTIYDGTPDAQGNLLDANQNVLNLNWTWHGSMRLEGAELAALPAGADSTPTDPRYQAIMGWLVVQVRQQYEAYAVIKAAEAVVTQRPDAEVAALPAITALPA